MSRPNVPSPAVEELLEWLRQKHASLKEVEDKALEALHRDNDQISYRELMLDRAEMIAGLDVESARLTTPLADDIREGVESQLRRFAKGARNALRIDSIFYMSALLYPDEHKPGEPDNLERLIKGLAGD